MGKNSRAKKARRELVNKARTNIELLRKHNITIDSANFPDDDQKMRRVYAAFDVAAEVVKPLDRERTSNALIHSAQQADASLDKALADISDVVITPDAGTRRLACKLGCNYCCTMRVTAMASEIIRCAAFIRDKMSEATVDALRIRIDDYLAEGKDLTHEEIIDKPRMCPLNDAGRCVAYQARPLACRAYHSFDAERCRQDMIDPQSVESIPVDPLRQEARLIHLVGIRSAYKSLAIDTPELEFIPALKIALDHSDAGERLLANEKVFAAAHNPELIAFAEKDLSNSLKSIK